MWCEWTTITYNATSIFYIDFNIVSHPKYKCSRNGRNEFCFRLLFCALLCLFKRAKTGNSKRHGSDQDHKDNLGLVLTRRRKLKSKWGLLLLCVLCCINKIERQNPNDNGVIQIKVLKVTRQLSLQALQCSSINLYFVNFQFRPISCINAVVCTYVHLHLQCLN